jgi:AP-1-like transcription factor
MSAQGLYLSPDESDLVDAARNFNQSGGRSGSQSMSYTPTTQANPGSGRLDYNDDSPYLDFDPDGEFDDSNFDFDPNGRMIGDLPDDDDDDDDDDNHLHDKRKSVGDRDDDEEGGGKRREGEDKTAKKPGRKPLTSEPTSVRITCRVPLTLLTMP